MTGFGPTKLDPAETRVLKKPVTLAELRVSTRKLEKQEPASAGKALMLIAPSKKEFTGIGPP